MSFTNEELMNSLSVEECEPFDDPDFEFDVDSLVFDEKLALNIYTEFDVEKDLFEFDEELRLKEEDEDEDSEFDYSEFDDLDLDETEFEADLDAMEEVMLDCDTEMSTTFWFETEAVISKYVKMDLV